VFKQLFSFLFWLKKHVSFIITGF